VSPKAGPAEGSAERFHRFFIAGSCGCYRGRAIIDSVNPFADPARSVVARLRREWPPPARAAAAVVATVVLAASAVAYGSTPSSAAAGGSSTARRYSPTTNVRKALAFSRCMRRHGLPNFPDPTSSGAIPKVSQQELGTPRFRAAERACQRLLPAGSDDIFPPGEVQQLLIGMLRFSHCMRSHGVPNWPDPTTDPAGRPEFPLEEVPGTDRNYWHQPRITHVTDECQHLLPSALGGIPVG